MSSEAERVAQGALHVAFLCLVERQVQIRVDFGIQILTVDRRRYDSVRQCENAGQRLYGTGGTQQVILTL